MDRRATGTSGSVGVIGLGYVGLPLALAFSEAGLKVVGIDANARRLSQVAAGESPIDDVSDDRLRAALADGFSVAAPIADVISSCDAVFVCVPTPIDRSKNPDLGPVLSAASSIAAGLRKGQLVVLQSTTYPGTTTGPFRAALEAGGLIAGTDFDLAYAPERINPGDPISLGAAVPRLVGGVTKASADRAAALLALVSDEVITLSTPDAAEMAKLFENVFRNVNIALVNELALLCERMGIDVWEVIDGASTKPFGFMRFTPGPGVGGHCIPVDPFYLAWRAREFEFIDRFIETAGEINMGMPRHVVDLTAEALNARGRSLRGARVGVIGVAFKANVSDARNSPAGYVLRGLAQRGAEVTYHDPHVAEFVDDAGVRRASIALDRLLADADVVVVLVPHRAVPWDAVFSGAPLVVDTVNVSRGHRLRDQQVLRLGAGWT